MNPVRTILVCLAILAPSVAQAHKYELGVQIQLSFTGLPAQAAENGANVLGLALGGGLGVEYHFADDFALVTRVAYNHALGDTFVGRATFNTITGRYIFQQHLGLALLGVRAETPPYWMPLTLGIAAYGGVGLFIHTARELRSEKEDLAYDITLGDTFTPLPVVAVSGFIGKRVAKLVRLGIEPTLYLTPIPPVRIGFGLAAELTFLFFP